MKAEALMMMMMVMVMIMVIVVMMMPLLPACLPAPFPIEPQCNLSRLSSCRCTGAVAPRSEVEFAPRWCWFARWRRWPRSGC